MVYVRREEDTAELTAEISAEDIIANFKANWELLTNLERMQFLQTYIQAIFVEREPSEDNPGNKQVKVKRLEFYKK
jgi:hypothetical protein